MATKQRQDVERHERVFYDRVYEQEADLALPKWQQTDPWALATKKLLGSVDGLRLLDLGCGTGKWAVFLATQGAHVTGMDISPQAVSKAKERAAYYDVGQRFQGVIASANEMPFPDHTFDLIYGAYILHHLDVRLAGSEIHRILKPNAIAVFEENSSNNKILMWARDLLCGRFGISKWSTDEEYPLSREQIGILSGLIGPCELSYPAFRGFRMLDDKLFGGVPITRPIDSLLYRIPFLRRYSYSQLLRFTNGN